MLQGYGLKSGILCNYWLDSLTELLKLKITVKKVGTNSLAEQSHSSKNLLMSSDQDWMPILKATFNQTQDNGLNTETNGLSSVVLSYAKKPRKVPIKFQVLFSSLPL